MGQAGVAGYVLVSLPVLLSELGSERKVRTKEPDFPC